MDLKITLGNSKYFMWICFLLQNYQSSNSHEVTIRHSKICQRHTELQEFKGQHFIWLLKLLYLWLITTNTQSGVWKTISSCHINYISQPMYKQEGQHTVIESHWNKLSTMCIEYVYILSSCLMLFDGYLAISTHAYIDNYWYLMSTLA